MGLPHSFKNINVGPHGPWGIGIWFLDQPLYSTLSHLSPSHYVYLNKQRIRTLNFIPFSFKVITCLLCCIIVTMSSTLSSRGAAGRSIRTGRPPRLLELLLDGPGWAELPQGHGTDVRWESCYQSLSAKQTGPNVLWPGEMALSLYDVTRCVSSPSTPISVSVSSLLLFTIPAML